MTMDSQESPRFLSYPHDIVSLEKVPLNTLILEMPYNDYAAFRADECVRATQLKAASKSVAHFRLLEKTPARQSDALMLGTLTHEALFEPERFKETASSKLSTLMEKKAASVAEGIAGAVKAHPTAESLLFKDGHARHEVSVFWQDQESGLLCKARFDAVVPGDGGERRAYVVDLKTCRDCSPDAFARDVHNFQYALQMDHYIQAAAACGLGHADDIDFFIVAAEKAAPFGLRIYNMAPWTEHGRRARRQGLGSILLAQQTAGSPCYTEEITVLEPPRWASLPVDVEFTFGQDT